ncbi:MAG: hypothetical protein ABJA70_08910 [Chryseolinea sp.]
MESKKDLYRAGSNPNYYEAFDDNTTAKLLMALDDLRIAYTRMPRLDHGIKSLRLYVENKDASNEVTIKEQYIASHLAEAETLQATFGHYQLVYDNSFI